MVVKDRVGRTRYMVFEIEPGGFTRRDFIRALNSASDAMGLRPSPRLTVFDGRMGILKLTHTRQDDVRDLLPSITEVAGMQVKVRSVRTSGTLRKAKEYLE
jgi:RNase P/RNase MRP subunit POP5